MNGHFTMLAGVCVDYCVETGREGRLAGEVFEAFVGAGQVGEEGGRSLPLFLPPGLRKSSLPYLPPPAPSPLSSRAY